MLVIATASACGGNVPPKAAAAAITLGMGVAAAAINRASTGDCWASCPTGTRCDKPTGTCVPLPCRNACPADSRCVVREGRETCVRGGERDVGEQETPPTKETEIGPLEDAGVAVDPCRGLCFRGEKCAVNKDGVADCVPLEPR